MPICYTNKVCGLRTGYYDENQDNKFIILYEHLFDNHNGFTYEEKEYTQDLFACLNPRNYDYYVFYMLKTYTDTLNHENDETMWVQVSLADFKNFIFSKQGDDVIV